MKQVALKNVCQITNGGTPKSKVDAYWHGGVSWLTPAEMGKLASPYISKTKRTISDEGLAKSSAKLVPSNSVILSTRAPIGHLSINQMPMAFNQGCRGLTPGDQLDTKYLFYYLYFSRKKLNDLGSGTTFKELSATNLANFQIPLPPLEEQRRTVAVLDKAFAAIATATANAEKNLANARALFESYLHSVFTDRGTGWSESKLSQICNLISGQHIDAKDYNNENRGIGYLTGPSDFGDRTPEISKWTEHPKRTAQAGDILITVKGSGVGKINFLNIDNVAISRQLMAVRAPNEMIGYIYNFLLLKFNYFQKLANGAAIPGISRQDVLNLELSLPPPNKFEEIVAIMDDISESCSKLSLNASAKLAALSELKQSLLQTAFAGELT